ncbi:MBL fold metallo-hydrolase [Diaphorobacter aerolatus]|uniref:MBL fold metallo-hydrolase n=1 Tax=Diaphorobacter aerolatus TaxID=1288495 RepID=A0A7H0GLB1_9BURK|nr:MBL fold metallo-hydrolase [Diaphorobacter aerolatus]QNP49077.1 MBL fold metallo-hydrolase [Diaphorobacter aerolatus]
MLQHIWRVRGLRALGIVSLPFVLTGCAAWMQLTGESEENAAQPAEAAQVAEESVAAYNRNDQSPGFFRMKMGTYLVTVLYDGSFEINSKLMKGRTQAQILNLLKLSKQPRAVRTSVNAFLLDDGERVILVDAGASTALGTSMGKLATSLQMSGYKPDSVQFILLTHLHPDHDGGLNVDGAAAFPNAEVYVPEQEAAYWLSGERGKDNLPVYKGGLGSTAAYKEAGKFHTFTVGSSPIPGVQSVPLPGHTPGHTGYRIRSGKESMLIWGDVVHNAALQLSDPTITVEFDMDQSKARATRAKALKDAATSGEWIAGSHLPFPAIGRVQAAGKTSYRWLPIDYAQAMMDADTRQPMDGK